MTLRTAAALLVAPACLSAACRGTGDPGVIPASGHVEATDVRVAAKVPGRVASFAVREGDTVAAGQELARIDDTDLKIALSQARAERDMAAAELRLRLAGPRAQDVAELEAQLAAAEADRVAAERDLARMEGLLERGSGTEKARDDARVRRDVTASRVAALKQSLSRMKEGSREEEKDASRARLAAAAARVALAEQQEREAVVVSPAAGIVTETIADAGELLTAGAPICVVTRLAEAWLTIYVGEPDLGRVTLGQDVEVRTDDGQVRRGKITFIASQAEFTPRNVQTRDERVKLVYRVKVGLENADGFFKPGMPAEARIRTAS